MRLLLCIDSLGPGGAERVLSLLATRWANHGHKVCLVTLSDPSGDFFEMERVERRVIGATGPARNPVDGLRLLWVRSRRLASEARRFRPDAMVCFMPRMAAAGVVAAHRTHVPVVVSERTDPRHVVEGRLARWVRTRSYRRADIVVVPTESLQSWISSFNPVRTAVIPNPVNPDLQRGPSERPPVVLGLGRLGPEKGFDLLLEAFAQVSADRPDWTLRIHGEGPLQDELAALARELLPSGIVELAGRTEDAGGALAGAGIFVLASRHEGFPNVLLEALATGTPSIATCCTSGPTEILTDRVDGLLVPPNDAAAIAAALAELMDDEHLRRWLADRGCIRVRDFDLEHIGQRWDQLLLSLRSRRI